MDQRAGGGEVRDGPLRVYPVFLIGLERRLCVVVGGATEALLKVRDLRRAGAVVRVVAPELVPGLRRLVDEGQVEWLPRPFRSGDLAGAWLAIAATHDPGLNAQIAREAEERGTLLNAVDDVPHCNFIAPSVLRQGDLVIAISTSGKAPALAVRIRQRLEEEFGPDYAALLVELGRLRPLIAGAHADVEERRRTWYALVDADLLSTLAAGGRPALRDRIRRILVEQGVVAPDTQEQGAP